MTDPVQETALLMGEDHLVPNEFAMCSVGASWSTYAAISLGGIQALHRKGGTEVPNEDCLFAADFGDSSLHAVADGHKGPEASHEVIERIAEMVRGPSDLVDPIRSLQWLTVESLPAHPPSARTTVSITAIDRKRGRLSGLSIGDSQVFLIRLSEGVRMLNECRPQYVTPWAAECPSAVNVVRFQTEIAPGDLVLSCTDGITECHYGSAATSISADDLLEIQIRTSGSLERFVETLAETALDGVRGHPGGEDNFAIVATLV